MQIRLLFISLGMLLGLELAQAAMAAPGDPRFEVGVDRPGRDFGAVIVTGGPEECAERCGGQQRCRAWTFVPAGGDPLEGRCWLKHAVPPAMLNPDTISGIRLPEPAWAAPRMTEKDSPEAALAVRVGDIDNFGFAWPENFTPFSGEATPVHAYPWQPEPDDPAGTDRIMVGSGHAPGSGGRRDGYAAATRRPANLPEPINLSFTPAEPTDAALLRLMVDDFQPGVFGGRYQITLDGQRALYMERALNALEQTGPTGKLVTLEILSEQLPLLEDGELSILIDDTESGAGDGYALDFVQLLINPGTLRHTGTVDGTVHDATTGEPLAKTLVSSAVIDAETSRTGAYALRGVPAGLVVVQASHPGYEDASRVIDLVSGERSAVNFHLTPRTEGAATIQSELATSGRSRLQGVYFDTGSAELDPASTTTLNAIAQAMRADPAARYTVEGHTDSTGGAEANLTLSQARAQAVVTWLIARGLTPARLEAVGLGETAPVADNRTASGRRLNRRVEVVLRR